MEKKNDYRSTRNGQSTCSELGINPAVAVIMNSDPSISYEEACRRANIKALRDLSQEEERITVLLWRARMLLESRQKGFWWGEGNTQPDGRVFFIIEGNLNRFVALCFEGKRESSFGSFLSWAHSLDKNPGARGLRDFHKLVPQACREAWKSLPRSLKRGQRYLNGKLVYSTSRPGEGIQGLLKEVNDKLSYLRDLGADSNGWKNLHLKAKWETLYEEYYHLAYGWK